jgi:hypothetical protein
VLIAEPMLPLSREDVCRDLCNVLVTLSVNELASAASKALGHELKFEDISEYVRKDPLFYQTIELYLSTRLIGRGAYR